MEADIVVSYSTEGGTVHSISGSGKLYRSIENDKYYIYCEEEIDPDIPDALYDASHAPRRSEAITENGESYFIERDTETGEVISDIEYYSPIFPNEEAYIDYFQTYWEADTYLNQFASLPEMKRIKQTYQINSDTWITKYIFSGNLYEGEGEELLMLEVTADGYILSFTHGFGKDGRNYYKTIGISDLKLDSPDFAMPDVSIDDIKAKK